MICAVKGWIIVSKVKSYSVAGENGRVEKGDIITDIANTNTFNMAPDTVADLVRKGARRPMRLCVVKANKNGRVFMPMVPLLKEAGISALELEDAW